VAVRTDFPRRIRRIDHTWIALSDGTRLGARIWLPEDAERDPVPAILEYLPYRKGDAFARRDSHHHPYFAGFGYAGVRVDIRGTGDSDGILEDEYLPQEQDDAIEVIEWLAEQPWCSGAVGMIGISWGGFNGLQVAARRPPALQAVISMCASDDRYADDVHYVGGCVLAVDMLPWAATMLTGNALPPHPDAVGDGWRETWLRRIDETPAYIEAWLGHQRRDEYWQQGSVCEDYSAIDIPVYAVGGWADGYSNAVPRLMEGLPGPRKGLVGPWSHAFPQDGAPGPTIGFLQECLRWFDHHLKGVDTGIMDEPMLRVWMQEPVAPATHYKERPGRWVAEREGPPRDAQRFTWDFTPPEPVTYRGRESTGVDAGAWCPDGGEGDWPADQRGEDAHSLTFTSEPLDDAIEILGFAEVKLDLEVDRATAFLAVRLCDIAPDGSSLLITRGVQNLARGGGPVRLDAIAQRVPAGHRLRVGISTNYWPWVWPSPEPVTLALRGGRLTVPTRPPKTDDLPEFGPPEWAQPLAVETMAAGRTSRRIVPGQMRFEWDVGGHRRLKDSGIEMDDTNVTTYRIADGDPLSASVRVECSSALGRGAWRTRVETDSEMTATTTEFVVEHRLDAYEGDELIRSRSWSLRFPRDGV
jgi:uncharacterized protein